MERLNIRKMKMVVCLVCAISIMMSSFVITEAAENEKNELKIERYYASKDNEQYFDYFIVPDPVAEGYNGLYITELSPNYGKYLEVPDTLSGVVVSDVYLMDLDKTEEVKVGDNVINFSCVYPEKNFDGTPGKYADAFSKRKWFYSAEEYKQSEECKTTKPNKKDNCG